MNIQELKKQAQRLIPIMNTVSGQTLSLSQAREAIARLHGVNLHVLQAADRIGDWNAVQALVHSAYPNADLLPLEAGKSFEDCGDTLFKALMHVAGSQPLTRVTKTVEHWAKVADTLLTQVVRNIDSTLSFAVAGLPLPRGLAPTFQQFLECELHDEELTSWVDLGARLDTIRRDLYSVAVVLRREQCEVSDDVMLLDSQSGTAYAMAVRVPNGTTPLQARAIAGTVLQELQDKQHDAANDLFDYSQAELGVKLFQAGLIPLGASYVGPQWD